MSQEEACLTFRLAEGNIKVLLVWDSWARIVLDETALLCPK